MTTLASAMQLAIQWLAQGMDPKRLYLYREKTATGAVPIWRACGALPPINPAEVYRVSNLLSQGEEP